MSDLTIGLVIMTLLCVVLFRLGLRAGRFCSQRGTHFLAVTTVVLVLAYNATLWESPLLAKLLPFSNLIVVGNWFPLGAALLSGVIFELLPRPRRGLMLAMLAGSSAICLIHPLMGTAPQCRDEVARGSLVTQTTTATCSAACAASLLRTHGIWATEQEMADLCLTRAGTRWQGLYRGLKTKTRNTGWDVEVLTCEPDQLQRISGPLILTVGLDASDKSAAAMRAEFGWDPSVRHSVIQLSTDSRGNATIFDPSPAYGKEHWTAKQLKQLYRGHAMRLVHRSARAPQFVGLFH